MPRLTGVVFVAAALIAGCEAGSSRVSQGNRASHPGKTQVPFVPALDFTDTPTETVLQRMADIADADVTFEGCDEFLNRNVSIHTTERKPVPVVMAMLITQLSAAASLEANQWTLFCSDVPGPGRLLRKGQPSAKVTVQKAPEGSK